MPQIWLSCEELAHLLELDAAQVEAQAKSSRRELRTGKDGVMRILLSDSMAREYIRLQVEAETRRTAESEPAAEAPPVATPATRPAQTPRAPVAEPDLVDQPMPAKAVAEDHPPASPAKAGTVVQLWNRYKKVFVARDPDPHPSETRAAG